MVVLRDSVIEESQTGKVGLDNFDDMASSILVKRLKVIDDRKRHPEISKEEVRSPLVVVGLPRAMPISVLPMLALASLRAEPWCNGVSTATSGSAQNQAGGSTSGITPLPFLMDRWKLCTPMCRRLCGKRMISATFHLISWGHCWPSRPCYTRR